MVSSTSTSDAYMASSSCTVCGCFIHSLSTCTGCGVSKNVQAAKARLGGLAGPRLVHVALDRQRQLRLGVERVLRLALGVDILTTRARCCHLLSSHPPPNWALAQARPRPLAVLAHALCHSGANALCHSGATRAPRPTCRRPAPERAAQLGNLFQGRLQMQAHLVCHMFCHSVASRWFLAATTRCVRHRWEQTFVFFFSTLGEGGQQQAIWSGARAATAAAATG